MMMVVKMGSSGSGDQKGRSFRREKKRRKFGSAYIS
jgi:hypothetical protein